MFALSCIKVESLTYTPAKTPLLQIWGKRSTASVCKSMCQNIQMCQSTPLPPHVLHYPFPGSFQRIPGPRALTTPSGMVVVQLSAVTALSCPVTVL